MSDPLLRLLDQRPKNARNWRNEIVIGSTFFDTLRSNEDLNWEIAGRHLLDYLEVFKRDIHPPFNRNRDIQLLQWQHAAKLFLCARYVSEQRNRLEDLIKTTDGKFALTKEIRERSVELLEHTAGRFNFEEREMLLLTFLFLFGLKTPPVRIPFATAPGPLSKGIGRIHWLELTRCESFGWMGRDPRCFPGAHGYFEEITGNFENAVDLAFRYNQQVWSAEELADDCRKYGFIWNVTSYEHKIEESAQDAQACVVASDSALRGKSIGLAAAVGIYHALRNTIPDDRIIFSAQIMVDSDGNPTGKFEKVEGIPAKLMAAIQTGVIDTMVIHESNFTGETKREIESILFSSPDFRIKRIDSDGNER